MMEPSCTITSFPPSTFVTKFPQVRVVVKTSVLALAAMSAKPPTPGTRPAKLDTFTLPCSSTSRHSLSLAGGRVSGRDVTAQVDSAGAWLRAASPTPRKATSMPPPTSLLSCGSLDCRLQQKKRLPTSKPSRVEVHHRRGGHDRFKAHARAETESALGLTSPNSRLHCGPWPLGMGPCDLLATVQC